MKNTYMLMVALITCFAWTGARASSDGCGPDRNSTACGSVYADKAAGQFHGLIMVAGQPDVLATAAHSGTRPGCGDCVWTLILMCRADAPIDPPSQQACTGAGNTLHCRRSQASYRLYLTTDADTNVLVET